MYYRMSLHVLICTYVLVCSLYVTCMYSYVTRMYKNSQVLSGNKRLISLVFSKFSKLSWSLHDSSNFVKTLKILVKLILNYPRDHAITHINLCVTLLSYDIDVIILLLPWKINPMEYPVLFILTSSNVQLICCAKESDTFYLR